MSVVVYNCYLQGREHHVTLPRVPRKHVFGVLVAHRAGRRLPLLHLVLELVQGREVVRADRPVAPAPFDARVAATLPGALVAVVVDRAADVTAAFCTVVLDIKTSVRRTETTH